jgi:hypothetical protein
MLTKLGELLKQASYSIYELLYVLWNKVNDVIDSHNTTDQKLTDEINTRITEDNKKVNNTDFNTLNKLDFKGTWQGLRPSQADPGISSVVDRHTTQLNDIGIDIENFPRLIPEVDDTGRFQRLFNSLPVNGGRIILKQGANYTISGQPCRE